eukprot:TRINITY_DN23171_c0_g1_i1.p1 TRINITY_DN23171_c0_g1~~TRINITY_DN23171_c0_g1_i1.p1  ORF type:complete len:474 (+),score=53.05 TRINITY_DN23171_c0_g1_i1:986-2407(+)
MATTDPAASNSVSSEKAPLLPPSKGPPPVLPTTGSAGHGIPGGSMFSAVFNLSTTSIGAGIMALPATMKVLGLPLGSLLIILMGVLTDLSIALIMRFSTKFGARSYSEMMAVPFGRTGRRVVQAFVILHTIGSLMVYMIIIGDVLSGTAAVGPAHHSGIFEELAGGPCFWNSRPVVMLATMVLVLWPLCSFKQIDSLMVTSALSVGLAVLFVLFIIVATAGKALKSELEPPKWLPGMGSFGEFIQIFTVIPVMTNAFICHYNVHPIYEELSDPTEARMRIVSRYSQTMCTLVYLTTAVFGYLLFGQETASDVLANFDSDLGPSKILQDCVRIGYVLHLVFVFPIVFYPLRQTIDAVVFSKSAPPLSEAPVRFHLVTAVLVLIIYVTSIFIPDIYILFAFMGAVMAVSIGFTFPALIAVRSEAAEVHEGERWEVWLMLCVGLLVTVTGLATNIFNTISFSLWGPLGAQMSLSPF